MPRLVFAVPCFQVIHDSETNLMSYLNCVEQVVVPQLPHEFGEITIGTNWVRTEDLNLLHLRLRVDSPSGQPVAEKVTEEKDFQEFERVRYNIRLPVFEAREEGDYIIHVESKLEDGWKAEASLPVRVTKLPSQDEREAESA